MAADPDVRLNLDAIDQLRAAPPAPLPWMQAPVNAAMPQPAADLPAVSKIIRKPLPENIEYPRIHAPSHDPKADAPPEPPQPASAPKPSVKKSAKKAKPKPKAKEETPAVSAPPIPEPVKVPEKAVEPEPPVPPAEEKPPLPEVKAPEISSPAPPIQTPVKKETPKPAVLPPLDALKEPSAISVPVEKKPEIKPETPKPAAEEKPKNAKAAPVTPVDETPVPPPPGLEPKPDEPATDSVVLGEMHKAPEDAPPAAVPAPVAPTPEQKPAAPTTAPEIQLVFKATETAVPLSLRSKLDAVAEQIKGNDQLRAMVIAYATATGSQATTARRVSLSRALSVRAYLIDQGVASKRINVQAEGDKGGSAAPDRVDVFLSSGE